MHAIQRYIFVQNRFYGPWSSQRPSASFGLFLIILDDFNFLLELEMKRHFGSKREQLLLLWLFISVLWWRPCSALEIGSVNSSMGTQGQCLIFIYRIIICRSWEMNYRKIFGTVLRCSNLQGSLVFMIKRKTQNWN